MISGTFISNMESEDERLVCFAGIYSCAANSDNYYLMLLLIQQARLSLFVGGGGGGLFVFMSLIQLNQDDNFAIIASTYIHI